MQNIEEVYLEHSKLVYKYLFCLTHNNELAEELTQETFVCAIKEINNFKGNSKLSTWLCQIAKNLWYKELRKIKKAKITRYFRQDIGKKQEIHVCSPADLYLSC